MTLECRPGSLEALAAAAAAARRAPAKQPARQTQTQQKRQQRDLPAGVLAGVFVPENVVEHFEDCPVAAPTPWDDKFFNASPPAVRAAVERYRPRLSAGGCADAAAAALSACAGRDVFDGTGAADAGDAAAAAAAVGYLADGWPAASVAANGDAVPAAPPPPALPSMATVDGCCGADACAARIVQERRCLHDLYQLACVDAAAKGFAAGL